MKIALFDFRSGLSDELVLEYFDFKKIPYFLYHYNENEDCYIKVMLNEFFSSSHRMITRKDFGDTYYPPNCFDIEEEVAYAQATKMIEQDRCNEDFIEFATNSPYLSRNVNIVEVATGTKIRIRQGSWRVETYEEFKEDEWITAI